MLALSATLLSLSAVSFIAAGRAWLRGLGGVVLSLSLTACVWAWGGAVGPLVQLVLAMTAASLLVLILPVRAELAKPVAIATAALGLVLLLGARLLS
jgi:hypothetical protein